MWGRSPCGLFVLQLVPDVGRASSGLCAVPPAARERSGKRRAGHVAGAPASRSRGGLEDVQKVVTGSVATSAESLPHDSPDAEWHAHQTTFVLADEGLLRVVDVRDFTEPVTDDPGGPSFRSGETLCGSNLGPPVPIP